ncbi:hypothetical protein KA005_63235, partial [bacterium]|nr:hypothetical protein [bacterium]
NIHVSDEERGEIVNALTTLENQMSAKVLDYESKALEARASIIKTEAQGQSSLQRNWRPITMLTFLILVVCDSFGLLVVPIADQMWTLLQLGLGGYVIGRSAEKVLPSILSKFGKK